MPALSAESLQTLAILLSTGVDPFRTIIVQQSRVPELTCPLNLKNDRCIRTELLNPAGEVFAWRECVFNQNLNAVKEELKEEEKQ